MNEKEIPFGRPWIDDVDRNAVLDVLNGHVLTHGPKCKEFEEKFQNFMGDGFAVTTSSCMASLHLAAIYFGFGPGDEVIVPAQTHVATVHAVELVGATPVFIDCELKTGNIDIDQLESKITSKTKGIFIVHFAGIAADMEKICDIAQKYNLIVVEDCALAVGARFKGKHVGLWGDAGCYSFYPVKHMTTAEGGMLVSKSEKVSKEIAHFRAFSVDRSHSERKIAGVYDVTGVGLNYRMSEMQAALGCTQLAKMNENLRIRKENFDTLKSFLVSAGFIILDGDYNQQNSYYCLIAILPDVIKNLRNDIVLKLSEQRVGCSVYYPQPVPRMTYYQNKYKSDLSQFPNATVISDNSIALPVGPHLTKDDMQIIANVIIAISKESGL